MLDPEVFLDGSSVLTLIGTTLLRTLSWIVGVKLTGIRYSFLARLAASVLMPLMKNLTRKVFATHITDDMFGSDGVVFGQVKVELRLVAKGFVTMLTLTLPVLGVDSADVTLKIRP